MDSFHELLETCPAFGLTMPGGAEPAGIKPEAGRPKDEINESEI